MGLAKGNGAQGWGTRFCGLDNISSLRGFAPSIEVIGRMEVFMIVLRFGSQLGVGLVLLAVMLTGTQGHAAAQAAVPAGPVPAAIPAAKKLFIANGGADAGLFPHPFSGNVSRGYDEFYAAVKGMGRYELVTAPADADLVLEFRLLAPLGPANADKSKGAADPLPTVRVKIYDRASHYVLWAFSEEVEGAAMQQTHDRKLDDAIARLVGDFQGIAGK
jgi:hypothetical protein